MSQPPDPDRPDGPGHLTDPTASGGPSSQPPEAHPDDATPGAPAAGGWSAPSDRPGGQPPTGPPGGWSAPPDRPGSPPPAGTPGGRSDAPHDSAGSTGPGAPLAGGPPTGWTSAPAGAPGPAPRAPDAPGPGRTAPAHAGPEVPGSAQGAQPWGDQPHPAQQWGGPAPAGPPPHPGYRPSLQDHPRTTTVFVLGLLGVLLAGVTGPFALVLGRRARREAAGRPDLYRQRGLLLAGYAMGALGTLYLAGTVLTIVGAILFFPAMMA